jgi:uncharacterized membrane protein YfcA
MPMAFHLTVLGQHDAGTIVIAFVTALAGSAIATWTGFGAATILTPVLAALLEVRQAILVVAIYHGIHNLIKIVAFRQGVVIRVAVLFGWGAIVFSLLGGLVSAVAPMPFLKMLLGGFLIFDAAASFKEKSNGPGAKPGNIRAVLGGSVSGFAAGIIGTGGAVRALFLHHFLREKNDYIATSAVIALVIDASRVPVYLTQYPTATSHLWPIIFATVSAGLLGVLFARGLLKNVGTEKFRGVLMFALIAAGGLFVVDGLRGLI